MGGGTADSTTLSGFLDRIEKRYGRANRIWVMDRGIPTEDSLAKMRSIGASYLVGTPKGRLTKLEQAFLGQPWAKVRDGVQVKRLATEEDVYVLAQSDSRIDKERGMRRKRLRRYVDRLKALQGQVLTRDQLLMKLGAARHEAGRAAHLVQVTIPKASTKTASLEFKLDRIKLRQVRRREGRYLLRTNLGATQPERLWTFYIQLTEVEQAFKELKHDLAVRPIFHRTEERIEAHIFVAFLAYCLQVTLKARLRQLAGGLTPREVIAKFKSIQMVDVRIPTTDGRELLLSRHTQPEAEHRMLLELLRLTLPAQPPPKITASQVRTKAREAAAV
jgi:transposase